MIYRFPTSLKNAKFCIFVKSSNKNVQTHLKNDNGHVKVHRT